MLAQGAAIGGPVALDSGQKGGIKGVALRAITPFARALLLSFGLGWLLHLNSRPS
jgi:hypothetical protein